MRNNVDKPQKKVRALSWHMNIKKRMIPLLAGAAVLLSINTVCTISGYASGTSSSPLNEDVMATHTSEAAAQTDVEMTEQELQLLASAFQEDAGVLKEGLFDFQKKALDALRTGTRYLSEKYPGHSFEIVTFTPANVFRQESSCTFICSTMDKGIAAADEEYLLSIVYNDEKDEYQCADTFYGALFRERYDQAIMECLEASGITSKEYTTFSVPMGKEIDGTLSVDMFLAMDPPVTRMTSIFLSVPEDENLVASIGEAMSANQFYGSCYVYFNADLESTSAASLQENRKSMSGRFLPVVDFL